jgi:hypothetical protein
MKTMDRLNLSTGGQRNDAIISLSGQTTMREAAKKQ